MLVSLLLNILALPLLPIRLFLLPFVFLADIFFGEEEPEEGDALVSPLLLLWEKMAGGVGLVFGGLESVLDSRLVPPFPPVRRWATERAASAREFLSDARTSDGEWRVGERVARELRDGDAAAWLSRAPEVGAAWAAASASSRRPFLLRLLAGLFGVAILDLLRAFVADWWTKIIQDGVGSGNRLNPDEAAGVFCFLTATAAVAWALRKRQNSKMAEKGEKKKGKNLSGMPRRKSNVNLNNDETDGEKTNSQNQQRRYGVSSLKQSPMQQALHHAAPQQTINKNCPCISRKAVATNFWPNRCGCFKLNGKKK